MAILITGGAGYIGAMTARLFAEAKEEIVIFDNLSRGHREALPAGVPLEVIDLTDMDQLREGFRRHRIDGVIHFAAFAFVGESVRNPQMYHQNNVTGGLNLLEVMTEFDVRKIVFSSSCSLYGNVARQPITEETPPNPINPYAETKAIFEQLLTGLEQSHKFRFCSLRYFNAGGAHPDGTLGESHDPEEHLIPLAIMTAMGRREKFSIFGGDYPTPDGSCVRDYVHVCDIAKAHVEAWRHLKEDRPAITVNLGTGKGFSVREIVAAIERISGRPIPTETAARRAGDPATLVANYSLAGRILNWQPTYTLDDIVRTAWQWHQNPRY